MTMARRYRVLYIENASGVGGSVISLYRLVQRLDRERYEPIVLFHRPNGYAAKFRELGVDVLHLGSASPERGTTTSAPISARDVAAGLNRYHPALAQAYRELKALYYLLTWQVPEALSISRVIRERRIDLVHLNNQLALNGSGALAARWNRTPCLCHVRDYNPLSQMDRWLAGGVSYFVFISRMLETILKRELPGLHGSVVYDGLELEPYTSRQPVADIRQRLGLKLGDFVVGNLGRLTPWKGQKVFLNAVAQARPHVPHLKALIVGEPDPPTETTYQNELRALTDELGVSEVVRFTGFQKDVPAVLSALDVLVHSSSVPEPFGLVIIEGMAAGKPVVATSAGGVLDIIDHGRNGLLVPVNDAQAMSEAMVTLARDRALAERLSAQARQHVENRFTVTQFARGIEGIYQFLLGQPEEQAGRSAVSARKALL